MWNGTDPVTDGKTAGIEERKQRGLTIAAMAHIDRDGDTYLVPSVTSPRQTKYKVTMGGANELFPKCTCPDFETRGCKCKHIYAVEFYIQRERSVTVEPDGTTTITDKVTITKTRKTYPQNWPAYNEAQTNEKRQFQVLLADLCKGIEDQPSLEEKPSRGRPPFPLRDAIFSVVFKVYSTFSGRRFVSDLCDAQAKGFIERVPHYNTAFKYMENPALYPILMGMIQKASLPLSAVEENFAGDSTGFCFSRFIRWYDVKYNRFSAEQQWIKAHIMTGVKTNIVTAVEIHGRDAGDALQLPALVKTTAKSFTMKEVSLDKGYTGEDCHQAIAAVGATPYIMFKANSTGGIGGLYGRMFHYFNYRRDEFLTHYHQRSNVESTVMMVKTKHGDSLRSKTDAAAKNEVLCKFLCHNICVNISAMYELGIQPMFAN